MGNAEVSSLPSFVSVKILVSPTKFDINFKEGRSNAETIIRYIYIRITNYAAIAVISYTTLRCCLMQRMYKHDIAIKVNDFEGAFIIKIN